MRFIDSYFYAPNFWQKTLSIALLPISILYLIASIFKRRIQRFHDFGIPIISIGNLVAGGTGKTPFLLEVAKDFENIAVISRGYKRKSKNLVIVSVRGEIKASEEQSGDEAFMSALALKNASVIVCKNRKTAILKAKELGAKCVFLDDGFRFNFKKLNIILVPKLKPYFPFTIPSGIYRENPFYRNKNDIILHEGIDYKREVSIQNPTPKMLLLSAIANPARLEEFLPPNIIGKITLSDHARFNIYEITKIARERGATSLLVTNKDKVKLQNIEIPLSVLVLNIKIDSRVKERISRYVRESKNEDSVLKQNAQASLISREAARSAAHSRR